MDIEIQISELMSKHSSPLGSNEDRLIRIPAILREKLGLKTGLFLCLTSKSDGSIPFQISPAYSDDVEKNSDECGYVSKDTYEQLKIEKKHNSLVKPVSDILIGADPEFFLIDKGTGGNVSASHFFMHYGDVGSDCGLAELRPRPSFNEYELVSNLRDLMIKAYQHLGSRVLFKNRKIEMIAASMLNGAAAGFHIHFGLPNVLLKGTAESHIVLKRMVDVLDYYVGILSILPEGSEDFYRRSDNSIYGKPGDYRSDHLTLEYRVPGGHLLRHPLLTAGILGISIITMKDLLSRLKIYSDNYEKIYRLKEYKDLLDLYPKLPSKEEVYTSMTSNNTDKAILYMKAIMDDMSKMVGYADKAKSIISYFDYVLSYIKHGKKFNESIEYNWRLKDEEQSREMAIL